MREPVSHRPTIELSAIALKQVGGRDESQGCNSDYAPDELLGFSCHDEMGLHDAAVPMQGVTLAVIPFGTSQAPYFDGALRSFLTIGNDPKYSQPYANALTIAAWICPLGPGS